MGGILVEKEENCEDNKTTEGGKDSDIVRGSFEEISLIFVMLEWSDSNLLPLQKFLTRLP